MRALPRLLYRLVDTWPWVDPVLVEQEAAADQRGIWVRLLHLMDAFSHMAFDDRGGKFVDDDPSRSSGARCYD